VQAGDNRQLIPLLDTHDAERKADDTGKDTFRLLAGKAYSHPSTRQRLLTDPPQSFPANTAWPRQP
jgi:hypothetical protein